MLCGVGGLLSCGITHTLVTPLDMVKCRIQTNPAKYKSIVNGFRVIYLKIHSLSLCYSRIFLSSKVSVAEEGMKGLVRGWAPTAIGYSAQVRHIFYSKNSVYICY